MSAQSANGNHSSRDAIVMSGWTWENSGLTERLAFALTLIGGRVLYCENPVSRIRSGGRDLEQLTNGVYRFSPKFFGHRLNRLPFGVASFQARIVADQILKHAWKLNLGEPLIIYAWGDFMVPVAKIFKRKGFRLIHCCFDYLEPGQDRHIELSDCTLVISRTVFHQLKARFGKKLTLIPEVGWFSENIRELTSPAPPTAEFAAIPRPRLGYIGPVTNRLNLRVLEEVLAAHPDWHFVHIDRAKCLSLPNVHVISWREPERMGEVIGNLDIGFMPYDCYSNKNFHCLPIKLFDYFYAGLPVVSTPIVNLWEYSDTIYFGDDAGELARAIQLALNESPDSQRRLKRMEIAREHSIEALAEALSRILFPGRRDRPDGLIENRSFESAGSVHE